MDSQKTTSKTSLLNFMILKAWTERWTDCKWGINIKSVLTRGVSGDVYNLADCILQQAVVGSGANPLILSYLKHSLCAHLISHAAVLKRISKYDNFDKFHCLNSLLDFLDSIINGVTCRGKPEESILTKSMTAIVLWLMELYEFLLTSHTANGGLTNEQKEVSEKMANILEKITMNHFLMGVIYLGKQEDPDMSNIIPKKFNEINIMTTNSGFLSVTHRNNLSILDLLKKLALVDISQLEMKEFDIKSTEPITYCLQPLLAVETLLNPSRDTQSYVDELLMIQNIKGYPTARHYCEIIRACLICLNNVTNGTSRESFICAFTFIKVPQILKQLHQHSKEMDDNYDHSPDVVEAIDLLLQDSPLLDFMDTKCVCNTVECLLNELLKHRLINGDQLKHFIAKREAITSCNIQKLEINSTQPSIVKFVIRAEPPLTGILKTLSADYNKVQEALLSMLGQVLSGNSFELILSVATVEGKLKTFVSRLIKCNESSKQIPGEMGKTAVIRAALFDVSFLMLTFILQNYGTDNVLDESGDTFFEKWAREYMVERKKVKSAMHMVRQCDPSKVDEILVHLNSAEGLKGSTLKWQEICANIPGVLYQILLAWESEHLSPQEIKKFLDNFKACLCSYSVCSASWLCAYMQTVQQDKIIKPMNMVQQFLAPISSDEIMQQENYKERLALSFHIIRKMQHDYNPSNNPKMRAIMQTQNIVSSSPLEEQFNEVWKEINERGWLPIESASMLESLLTSCGPYWLVEKLVQQLFKCKYLREMNKSVDIVLSIMHLDIERCTEVLLGQIVPQMLLNRMQNELVDPYSRMIAKLCVYAIISAMESPTSTNKKRTRGQESEDSEVCPTTKIRKLENSSVDSGDFLMDQMMNRETSSISTTTLKEPLQSCLQTLFRTFSQYIISDELSPKIYFMFQFFSLLVQVGKERVKPVLRIIPNGLISNLIKINAIGDMSTGIILRLYDLGDPLRRQFAMSDLCLLRNIQVRKDSIKM